MSTYWICKPDQDQTKKEVQDQTKKKIQDQTKKEVQAEKPLSKAFAFATKGSSNNRVTLCEGPDGQVHIFNGSFLSENPFSTVKPK